MGTLLFSARQWNGKKNVINYLEIFFYIKKELCTRCVRKMMYILIFINKIFILQFSLRPLQTLVYNTWRQRPYQTSMLCYYVLLQCDVELFKTHGFYSAYNWPKTTVLLRHLQSVDDGAKSFRVAKRMFFMEIL